MGRAGPWTAGQRAGRWELPAALPPGQPTGAGGRAHPRAKSKPGSGHWRKVPEGGQHVVGWCLGALRDGFGHPTWGWWLMVARGGSGWK